MKLTHAARLKRIFRREHEMEHPIGKHFDLNFIANTLEFDWGTEEEEMFPPGFPCWRRHWEAPWAPSQSKHLRRSRYLTSMSPAIPLTEVLVKRDRQTGWCQEPVTPEVMMGRDGQLWMD